MSKIKVAIIGTGNIANSHVRSYQQLNNAEVVAACDINFERAVSFCDKYGIANVYDDHKKMLAEIKPDAVSICTWNNSHAELSIDAMKNGADVLCEKPLALNSEEARKMQEVSIETGRLLMVGFVRRFAQGTAIIKDFIDSGKLGDVYYAKTGCIRRCGNPTGWFADKSRSGGGPLIDLGVHMIDLCRYLMDKPETAGVYGVTFDNLGPREDVKMTRRYRAVDVGKECDVEDFASALIKFKNGNALAVEVSFTLHTSKEKLYCEIFGTKAGAEVAPDIIIAGAENGYNIDMTPVYTKETNEFQSMFEREIAHFVSCVRGETECLCPIEDGVELMRILDAVYKSAETGREIKFD